MKMWKYFQGVSKVENEMASLGGGRGAGGEGRGTHLSENNTEQVDFESHLPEWPVLLKFSFQHGSHWENANFITSVYGLLNSRS